MGVSRPNIKNGTKCRLVNHRSTLWQGLTSTQRWALELILSFNRMQSRVISLLTGHNTIRKHLNILGLMASPSCRNCSPEEETSAHVLWECEALATLSLTYLGFSLIDPEDVLNLSLGNNWNLIKGMGLPWPGYQSSGVQRVCQRPTCIRSKQAQIHCLFCSILFYCCIVMPAWTVLLFYPNHFCWCVLPCVYYCSYKSRPQVAGHRTSSKNSVHAHVHCNSGAAWSAVCGIWGD
jgi:hypothetical protein